MPFKLLILIAAAMLPLLVAAAEPAGQPRKEPVTVEPSFGKGACVAGEALPFSLLLTNTGGEILAIKRPKAADISFTVLAPDGAKCSASLKPKELGKAGDEDVWLQPGCGIEVQMGGVIIEEAGGKPAPFGKYVLTTFWKPQGVTGVAQGELPACRVQVNEYPLDIELASRAETYSRDDHIMLTVRMKNNGTVPVKLLNFFSPYSGFFELTVGGAQKEPFIKPLMKVTPDADKGWITLLPDESISVEFDATADFESTGTYYPTVSYRRVILLMPAGEKPRYTTQNRWNSKKLRVDVLKQKVF